MKMTEIKWNHQYLLVFILFNISCNQLPKNLPVEIPIDYRWEFSQVGKDEWLAAEVPGTVHSDLIAHQLLPDPNYRMNEGDVQWVETAEWEYRAVFQLTPEVIAMNNLMLDFKGLDTYAKIYLNNQQILETDNMFVGWEVDVKNYLKEGSNQIRIHFLSPVTEGLKKLQQLDYLLPASNEQAPYNQRTNVFTRKAPFHYGWDWGPRLVTSGIWRPVVLKAWNDAIIESVYIETRNIGKNQAKLNGYAEINVFNTGEYVFTLNIDGRLSGLSKKVTLIQGLNTIPFDFTIDDPKLWWSNGLGEPYLYDFSFTLQKDDVIIDLHELAYGVRTIRLVQEPDKVGRTFYFELNGVPVFMKGANVIPSETLTPTVKYETYKRLVKNAVAANMNMLRVWGGAIYEDDLFYELCDQNGILVWQDFMFACALQPGDKEHLDNIRKEAEYNVKRLRNHASIALWCGNNENLHGWNHWGWKEMYEPKVRNFVWKTYERIFYDILPSAVKQFDPKTAYWASSPSAYGNQLADRQSGDEHDWTIWFGQQPFSAYGDEVPRFVSEYGLQSFPNMHTISDFSVEDDWNIDSEVMRNRQRSRMDYISPGFDGNDMIKRYMERYYPVPENFEHFVYVSQLLQAKAYQSAIEAHRRNMPHCMGSLYWQLNDSWPTISWATVDYFGRWKAAHYAVRKANSEFMVSPIINGDTLQVYAVSDRLKTISDARLMITLMDFNGSEITSMGKTIDIMPNTSTLILNRDLSEFIEDVDLKKTFVLIELFDGEKILADNQLYFIEPKDIVLEKPEIEITAIKISNGYELTIKSSKLVRNLFLDTPYSDVFITDNFFDLIPGKPKVVQLVTGLKIDTNSDITLLSLNDL